MKKTISLIILTLWISIIVNCKKDQRLIGQLQAFVGKNYSELAKSGINLGNDMCSPYSVEEPRAETDSTLVVIYSSAGCDDAEIEITINRKTNKIMRIRQLSLSLGNLNQTKNQELITTR
jgi:hypothetical protein